MKIPKLSAQRLALLLCIPIAIAAAATIRGAAASLPLTSDNVGAANTAIPRCPTTGTTVFENVTATNIVSVTVNSIDSSCGGGTLSLTVDNGTTTQSASGAVPGGGGTVTLTLGTPLAFAASARVDLVILGP